MRTFKIYSPSSFQIYDAVLLLTMVTMLYITSPGPIYFITGSLYTLTTFTHFTHTPPLASGNCQSVPFFYEFGDFFFFQIPRMRDFPGSPVVGTSHFQCRGAGRRGGALVQSLVRELGSACSTAQPKKKKFHM